MTESKQENSNSRVFFPKEDISVSIWKDKYRYGNERTIADTNKRVVDGIYTNKNEITHSYQGYDALQAYDAMNAFLWAPGGRILAGAGTKKHVTLINCYVNETVEDSMEGIMHALNTAAFTQQQGGGIGTDFSTIRPKGAIVKRTGSVSSGILPFMDMWNSMCGTIKSSGSRRGAMMGTLACWHPDILDFIVAKQKPGSLTNFNVSVLITKAFMEAVEKDEIWELGFNVPHFGGNIHEWDAKNPCNLTSTDWWKKLSNRTEETYTKWYVYHRLAARELWDMIIRNTYEYSEPGVIFIDRINEENNLSYCEYIHCVNPCFTGDTKVWTDRGNFAFKDLVGKTVNVLTQTLENKLVYRKMSRIRITQRNAKLVKVKFTDGSSVCVTPEHLFYTRTGGTSSTGKFKIGKSVEAGSLKQGQSISSVYRIKANQKGYQRLNNGYEYPLEHHVPFEEGIPNGFDVHHKDEVKTHNWKRNLKIIHHGIHSSHHMIGDKNPMRRFPEKNHFRNGFKGSTNGRWRDDINNKDLLLDRKRGMTIDAISRKYECSSWLVKERLKNVVNHKVASVEVLERTEDVYCGSVEETHRFFVALGNDDGVLVHNCGEQPLPPNGDCNLGAVNLAKLVKNPFGQSEFDYKGLKYVTSIGMRFLDNVLDVTNFPTPEQKNEAISKRRTGIGVMGLANMLQQMNLRYGSPEAISWTESVMRVQRDAAYWASVELAKERGPFPLFNKDSYLSRPYIKRLPEDLRDAIAEYGIRNGVIQTIAPTGTTSIFYENVSSGIEPTFSWKHYRKVLMPDNTFEQFEVEDYGHRIYREVEGYPKEGHFTKYPPYMVTALELSVDEHLNMQSACQKFIDSAISKTINIPRETTFEEFKDVYKTAYSLGLKGCTTYRPSDVRGSILTTDAEEKSEQKLKVSTEEKKKLQYGSWPVVSKRPQKLQGTTYKLKWPPIDQAFYVTINDHTDEHNQVRPFEIFINSKSVKHQEWITALTRCISAIFRRGGDITFIIEELTQVFSAQGGAFIEGGYVPSLVALIGKTIETHLIGIGLVKEKIELYPEGSDATEKPSIDVLGEICPKCSNPTLFMQEGCEKCACGYSSCG